MQLLALQLTREMKKSLSADELGRMASRVLTACLAVPIPSQHPEFDKFIETDRTPQVNRNDIKMSQW